MDTTTCQCNRHNSMAGGFWAGLLIGLCLALLVTTKKGRELLRSIIDEGLEQITQLENAVKEEMERVEKQTNSERQPELNEEVTIQIPKQAQEEVASVLPPPLPQAKEPAAPATSPPPLSHSVLVPAAAAEKHEGKPEKKGEASLPDVKQDEKKSALSKISSSGRRFFKKASHK